MISHTHLLQAVRFRLILEETIGKGWNLQHVSAIPSHLIVASALSLALEVPSTLSFFNASHQCGDQHRLHLAHRSPHYP
jgi:hypothetical protein